MDSKRGRGSSAGGDNAKVQVRIEHLLNSKLGEEKAFDEQVNTSIEMRDVNHHGGVGRGGHHARMILALAPTAPADWTQTTSSSHGSTQSICVEDDTDLISL